MKPTPCGVAVLGGSCPFPARVDDPLCVHHSAASVRDPARLKGPARRTWLEHMKALRARRATLPAGPG